MEGPRHQTIVASEPDTGRIMAMGSRSARNCFINGRPAMLPYLGALRVSRAWRFRRYILAEAYALCRGLRKPDEPAYCLSSIIADNHAARRLLGAALPDIPTYREVEPFVTLAIPSCKKMSRSQNIQIEKGGIEHLDGIIRCLVRNGCRYQFSPVWTRKDLLSDKRTPGLTPEDFLVAIRSGKVVGCLALWDQRAFKQAVVRNYATRLACFRPFLNLAAPWLGLPRLPRVGKSFDHAYVSHIAVDDDDPHVLIHLIEAVREAGSRRGIPSLLLGLAERNAMLGPVRRFFKHRVYRSILYAVHWEDGAVAVEKLDGRIPHVEVATL